MTKEEIESQTDCELIFMDGYDDCIVGTVERYGQELCVCYDKSKVLKKLIEDGMSEEEADEFFYFNQIGAYVGPATPCFINI